MQILSTISKCEMLWFLTTNASASMITSLTCGLVRKIGSVSMFKINVKGNTVRQKNEPVVQESRTNSRWTGGKCLSLHCDLAQTAYSQRRHPKNKYPFNIPDFPFPVLFIVFYPRLDWCSEGKIRDTEFLCEEEKIPCCHFSICCLCHILLLPLLIFSSFTAAVTSPIQCRVLLVYIALCLV